VFLGYSSTSKAYTCMDLETGKTLISPNVTFHEQIFPFKHATLCGLTEASLLHLRDLHWEPLDWGSGQAPTRSPPTTGVPLTPAAVSTPAVSVIHPSLLTPPLPLRVAIPMVPFFHPALDARPRGSSNLAPSNLFDLGPAVAVPGPALECPMPALDLPSPPSTPIPILLPPVSTSRPVDSPPILPTTVPPLEVPTSPSHTLLPLVPSTLPPSPASTSARTLRSNRVRQGVPFKFRQPTANVARIVDHRVCTGSSGVLQPRR
jgi:hypothetical protein